MAQGFARCARGAQLLNEAGLRVLYRPDLEHAHPVTNRGSTWAPAWAVALTHALLDGHTLRKGHHGSTWNTVVAMLRRVAQDPQLQAQALTVHALGGAAKVREWLETVL